ncbi:MAG: TIGR00295 family protein [Candidatus Freyarchaeota archaeon]|nr:TIGR00295 family protein [Candidatus Jordarchaeia archaeon]
MLVETGTPKNVIKHCVAVSRYARQLAKKAASKGNNVDIRLVEAGSLLHDIGRSKTHGVEHGVVGAEIVRSLGLPEELALIVERHVGAGIPKNEAEALGLPPKDYIPLTPEEKIVAHADNLTFGAKHVAMEKVLEMFKRELGEESPVIERLKKLQKDIEELVDP